jgi:hypothetical protein
MSTFTEINDTLKQIRYDLKTNISASAASGVDKAKNFIPKTASTMLDAAKDSIIQEIPAGRLLASTFSGVRAYFKNMKKSKEESKEEESKEEKQTQQETTLSDINSTIKEVGADIVDELKTLELMPDLLKAIEDLKCSNQSKPNSGELKAIESIREPIEGQFQVLENMADIAYEQLMDNKEAVDRDEVSAIKDKKPETSFIVGDASKIINTHTSSLLSDVGFLLSAIEVGLIDAIIMLKDKILGWIKELGKRLIKLTPVGRIVAIGLLLAEAFDYVLDHMDEIAKAIKGSKKFLIDGVADLWNNTAGNLPGAKKLVSDGESLTFVTKEEFDRNKVSGLGSINQQTEQNSMIQNWINYLTGNSQAGNDQANRQLLEKNLNNLGSITLDSSAESSLDGFKKISPIESLDAGVTTEARRLEDTRQSQLNTQQSNQSNNNLNIGGSSNSSNISIFNTHQNNKPMR